VVGATDGGGISGTLAEIARNVLANEFRSIDPNVAHSALEGPILPAYPEDLSESAVKQLQRLE